MHWKFDCFIKKDDKNTLYSDAAYQIPTAIKVPNQSIGEHNLIYK